MAGAEEDALRAAMPTSFALHPFWVRALSGGDDCVLVIVQSDWTDVHTHAYVPKNLPPPPPSPPPPSPPPPTTISSWRLWS